MATMQKQNISSYRVMETSTGDQEQPIIAANSPIVVNVACTPQRNLGMMVSSAGVKDGAHKCDVCGKTFAAPTRLTRHYRIHTGERPFTCEVCGKSFAVKENLSVHRRIHTKEKPYSCPHCDRGFEHSGKLSRHVRIHTGERPYKCTVCGKTYIQSGELVIHMRSHTGDKPYVCVVCNKRFTCSKQLAVHSRTHTGERPYACDRCDKTFAYSHVLKLHQNTHLSERLYKCTVCAETYSLKKALAVHIKTHTMSQDRHPRQLPPTHSGAAVVSSFPPTPSSSSTLLPSPTGGTEGIDPKPNRPLRLMSTASGIRIVDHTKRKKLMKNHNESPKSKRTLKEDSTTEHLIMISDRSTEGGGTYRHQLLPGSSSGSIFLGNAESVNEANSNSAKEVFSSDCKTNQHHNSGLNDGANHRDYNMTYSQLIPPLIPITADQSSIPMAISLIHSQQHGTEHPHPQ